MRFLTTNRLVTFLHVVGTPATALYFICMFAAPWFEDGSNWAYVQDVWDRWQSLNVGILAFVASVIAFNISRFNAENQRERDFLAAKAFLPAALSELVSYFDACAAVFKQGWEAEPGSSPAFKVPVLPDNYQNVFRECIRHAKPGVGDYLARILMKLQVHDARFSGYVHNAVDGHFNPERHNLITYIYRLGELKALVNRLFPFARNDGEFDAKPLQWDDFHTAYATMDIDEDDIRLTKDVELVGFTKRAIAREAGANT